MKRLHVGNLPHDSNAQDLTALFSNFGQVNSVTLLRDDSGRLRGFGFVDMPDSAEADKAIAGLNGSDHHGRKLTVNEARPRSDRSKCPSRTNTSALIESINSTLTATL
jgi:RNA recognition motif-containing protein